VSANVYNEIVIRDVQQLAMHTCRNVE